MTSRGAVSVTVAAGLILGAVAVWVGAQGGADEQGVIRYEKESRYYLIRVIDYPKEGRRCLHFSKSRGIQSSMFLTATDRLDLRYLKSIIAALCMPAPAKPAPDKPAAKDVLLIGLGGASLPKFIQKYFPDVRLDIVEIDPDVVKTCQEWFAFKGTPNTRVIVMDGRMYLKRSPKTYDVILLDAYASDRVPFHLTTLEFVQLVKSRLKPGGVAASNLWEHSSNRFYFAELKTFQATFPQTYLFKAGDSGNIIVFAALDEKPVRREDWVAEAVKVVAHRDFGFDLPRTIAADYEYLTLRKISEKPLTDDMAPVDTLRRENPKYFDNDN